MNSTIATCYPFPDVFGHVPRQGKIECLRLSGFIVITCWINDSYREIEAIHDMIGQPVSLTDDELLRINRAVSYAIECYAQDCDSDAPFVIDGSEARI